QLKIGNFPQTSLSEARVKLQELKQLRQLGRCPATELKEKNQYKKQEQLQPQKTQLTVKELIELYLVDRIEDRKGKDGKIISGSRKKKGQIEVRRMLEADVIRVLGERMAHEVTRKDVIELVREIDGRGAKVQAGNVLRELSAAYEFAIGLEYFDDNFANPALLAKSSLQQAKFKLTSNKGTRFLDDNELKK
ncbi:TPA: integrase, partial [Serratia marcescens]|nr:integrase [Serratia marcescens]